MSHDTPVLIDAAQAIARLKKELGTHPITNEYVNGFNDGLKFTIRRLEALRDAALGRGETPEMCDNCGGSGFGGPDQRCAKCDGTGAMPRPVGGVETPPLQVCAMDKTHGTMLSFADGHQQCATCGYNSQLAAPLTDAGTPPQCAESVDGKHCSCWPMNTCCECAADPNAKPVASTAPAREALRAQSERAKASLVEALVLHGWSDGVADDFVATFKVFITAALDAEGSR
jgi:ribosomal protein L37E